MANVVIIGDNQAAQYNVITGWNDAWDLAFGNDLVVLPNVTITDGAPTEPPVTLPYVLGVYSFPIGACIGTSVQIDGIISGAAGVYFGFNPAAPWGLSPTPGETSTLQIGATGLISTVGTTFGAVEITDDEYAVTNRGEIQSVFDAIDVDWAPESESNGSGGGSVTNYGQIDVSGSYGSGIICGDTNTTFADTIYNYGSIEVAGGYGIQDFGGHTSVIVNAGSIVSPGGPAILATNTDEITNSGQIDGAIYIGSGSSLANSGQIASANSGQIASEVSLGTNSSLANTGLITGPVFLDAGSSLSDTGAIDGSTTLAGASAGATDVTIGAGGVLTGTPGDDALHVRSGNVDVVNAGEISASQSNGASGTPNGIDIDGGGAIDNQGTIDARLGDGIYDTDSQDAIEIQNSGTIESSGQNAIFAEGPVQLVNRGAGGEIDGGVDLGAGSTLSDTAAIDGSVTLAGASAGATDVTIGAGGVLSGTPGDDALHVVSGNVDIVNVGEISASQNTAASGTPNGIDLDGGGAIDNQGTIDARLGDGVYDTDSQDAIEIQNSGTIESSGQNAIFAEGVVQLVNRGHDAEINGAVLLGAGSSLADTGTIDGALTFVGASAGATDVTVGAGGVLSGTPGDDALHIRAGAYDIKNDGEIATSQNSGNSGTTYAVAASGPGALTNDGKIEAATIGVYNNDNNVSGADYAYLYNHGTIEGTTAGVYDTGTHYVLLYNSGAIDGETQLNANSQSIDGAVYAASSVGFEDLINYASGIISGGVNLYASADVFNHGAIDTLYIDGSDTSVINSGTIGYTKFDVGATGSSLDNSGKITGELTWNAGPLALTNSGEISGATTGVAAASIGTLTNSGTIRGTSVGVSDTAAGSSFVDTNYLDNFGTISGSLEAIEDTGGHKAFVDNYGTISSSEGYAVYADTSTGEKLVNYGAIKGNVYLGDVDFEPLQRRHDQRSDQFRRRRHSIRQQGRGQRRHHVQRNRQRLQGRRRIGDGHDLRRWGRRNSTTPAPTARRSTSPPRARVSSRAAAATTRSSSTRAASRRRPQSRAAEGRRTTRCNSRPPGRSARAPSPT